MSPHFPDYFAIPYALVNLFVGTLFLFSAYEMLKEYAAESRGYSRVGKVITLVPVIAFIFGGCAFIKFALNAFI